MTKTAVGQLQEQIEAIRREAFAAGFEAAMQSVRQFASTQTPDGRSQSAEPARRSSATRRRAAGSPPQPGNTSDALRRRAAVVRPRRGTNARLVEEVLQSNAPRALRPAEIRRTIQREKGVAIAFTSIRHALGQLESRQVAQQVGGSNTWRYCGEGGDNFREGSDAAIASAE